MCRVVLSRSPDPYFPETAVISYPVETAYAAAVTNDVFNDSMPPSTPHGAAIDTGIKLLEKL